MKIKLLLFSIFVLLLSAFVSLRVQAADVTAGLIGYWNFDEGSGTEAADSSGSGNTGAISPNPTWIAGKVGNGSLQFNGASDKVLLGTKTIGIGTVTVCAWIKPTQPSYIQSIVNNYDFELYTYYNAPNLNIYISSNHDNTSASLGQITVNAWQHLCAIRQSDGTATLYLNGSQVGSGNSGTPTNVYNSVESIGSRPDGIYYFAGPIDDVRIYNRALATNEINDIYISAPVSTSTPITPAGDTTAPSIPTGLSSSALTQTGVTISWTASVDSGGGSVAGYKIYRNGTQIGTSNGTSYSDTNLTASTTYSYTVSAYDNAAPANNSSQSNLLSVTTPGTVTPPPSTGSITCSNNSDISAALITAIAAANDGDTIRILAGTCTLNSLITIQNKKIIIMGAGIDQTNITAPAGIAFQTKKIFRVSGITFKGNFGGLIVQQIPDYTIPLKGWRVDHIRFEVPNLTQGNGAVFVRGPLNYGVIDHVIFDATLQKNVYVATHLYGFRPDGNETIGGDLEWAQPSALGTDNAVYVEDSIFTIAATNIGFLNDINYGGRMVMRHNTITNGFVQTHAGGHGGRGGTSYEIYDNNFISNTQNYRPGQLRSGTGVIFNNNITGDWDIKNFTIDNVRTSALNGIYGLCDGTQPVDGNMSGEKLPNGSQSGWPCMDQIGRGSGGSLGHQPSDPLYSWNNNSGASSILLIDAWNSTNALQVDHVKTTGDVHPHVGGILDYVNNGTTPKPGYTPYAYPHLATVSGFVADDPNSPPIIIPPQSDTIAPTVSITSPSNNATVSGTVSLSASASDNVGGSGMAGVQFQVDAQNLGVEVVNPPYAGTWDTTGASNGTHVIKAVARDAAGNIATSTAVTVTVNNVVVVSPTPDVTPPTVPTGLAAVAANSTQVNLTWNASVDPTVNGAVTSGTAGYRIYRNNVLVTTVTGTSYSDSGLTQLTTYSYKIAAIDAATPVNVSAQTSIVSASTPASPPPPVPAVLSAGSPTSALAAGTVRATLSVVTDVAASCKYSTTANTAYPSMTGTFTTTGNTTHSTSIANLTDGSTYTYYIRCAAQQTLINTGDYIVSFSVSSPAVVTTTTGSGGTTSSGGTTGGTTSGIGSFTPLVQQPNTPSAPANGTACTPTTVPSTLAPLPTTSAGLVIGSRGTAVTTLQTFLVTKGYLTRDSITGYYGPLTNAAVTKYKAALLPRTVACPATATGATGTSRLVKGFQFTATLIPFATNAQVKSMQIFLNDHGYTVATTGSGSKGNETTYFGNATKAALIKFQKANNISPAIGNWGPLTRAKVNSLLK